MRQLPILPVALAAIAFGGCGSLDSNTDQLPVLATVQGKVIGSNDAVSVKGAVRVAVVWHIPVGGRLQVAQDLPVQPVFPASFTIQLDGPPPPEAMTTVGAMTSPPPSTTDASFGTAGGGGGGVMMQSLRPQVAPGGAAPSELAVGTVVAYADTNGNGMLDLLKDDAGTYIDQVVATNVDLSIVYFQGPVPPEARLDSGIAPVDGYNVVSLPPCPSPPSPVGFASLFGPNPACTAASDAGAPVTAVCMPTLKWLPISTPFVLTVASEPEVSSLLCQNGGPATQPAGASGSGGPPLDPSIQPAHYPDPCDPYVMCAPDGSDYQYLTCTTQYQGICLPPFVECTSVDYARPTPVPAGWPCTH